MQPPSPDVPARSGSPFRTAALLTILLITVSVVSADAARLDLRGPAGAEVLIDGEVRGELPLDEPIEIATGLRMLAVRAPGYAVHREPVQVDGPEDRITIDLDLVRLSRWQAMGSSSVLAGLGQLYQRRPVSGWTMMALQAGAWLSLAGAEAQYQDARDDYLEAVTAYEDAITSAEVRRARESMDETFDDVESKNDLRTYATVAIIAIGAYSVFDAWRAHGSFFAGPTVDSPAFSSASTPTRGLGVEMGWRWTF